MKNGIFLQLVSKQFNQLAEGREEFTLKHVITCNTYSQMFSEDDLDKRGVLHSFRENRRKEDK